MFLLVRADDTIQVNIAAPGEAPDLITVPDIKLPGGVAFTATKESAKATLVLFQRNAKTHPMLLWGSFTVGPATLWLVITNSAPVKAWLSDQLGAPNVDDFKSAIRVNAALRNRVRTAFQNGNVTLVLRLADGSLGTLRFGEAKPAGAVVVGALPPHVICGQSPMGLFAEDEDPAAMVELADLEV